MDLFLLSLLGSRFLDISFSVRGIAGNHFIHSFKIILFLCAYAFVCVYVSEYIYSHVFAGADYK